MKAIVFIFGTEVKNPVGPSSFTNFRIFGALPGLELQPLSQ